MTVKIGKYGLEFDSIELIETLELSIANLSINSKRFKIKIDYSSDNLTSSHVIYVSDNLVHAYDTIIATVLSDHQSITVKTYNVSAGSFCICISTLLFFPIRDILEISILVLT